MTPPPDGRRSGFRFGKPVLWWLGTALVLTLVGWSKSINLLLLLGFALAGLLACQAWLARRMTRVVRMHAGPTETAFAGDAVPVSFGIVNEATRVATFTVCGPHGLSWFFPQTPPGTAVNCSATVSPLKRGRHPVGRFTAVSAYPFGVLQYVRPLEAVPEVVVLPALGLISEKPFRHWLRHAGSGDHRRTRPARDQLPSEGDVRGTRPYRAGDNPRDVHWRSTARRGQLYVREYDRATPSDLAVIIEPYAPVAGGDYEPLEDALSLAATLIRSWIASDPSRRVRLMVLGARGLETISHSSFPAGMGALADAVGGPDHDWYTPPAALRRDHRIFVSSRYDSPWPSRFASAGVPVLVLDANHPPAWYRPPANVGS